MAKRLAFSIMTGALATACMSATDLTAINAAVEQFHEQQASGGDEAIYRAAAPDLRAAASLDALQRIDAAVRNVKGCSALPGNPNSWNNNVNTSGHFITVVYSRDCSGGQLVETFVFRMNGAQPLLMSYNASGMALFPPASAASAQQAPAADRPTKPAPP